MNFEVEEVVEEKIMEDETPGDEVGGSGHLSTVDFEIDKIDEPITEGEKIKITYYYTVYTTTEFSTPENPGPSHKYKKTIVVDVEGELVSEEKKVHL
jgi:hypothetical protein